jgi:hypothetical protein
MARFPPGFHLTDSLAATRNFLPRQDLVPSPVLHFAILCFLGLLLEWSSGFHFPLRVKARQPGLAQECRPALPV